MLPEAERLLSERDPALALIIAAQQSRWPTEPTEEPIWGLIRIIVAQQISTSVACELAERLKSSYPTITVPSSTSVPDLKALRGLGLSERRAQCVLTVIQKSDEIRDDVQKGRPWKDALARIKGIGPWTLATFRIMVLREPDEFPPGDIGLQRAVARVYGKVDSIERLGDTWRPFRSVACWYLWRTLGNEQLG